MLLFRFASEKIPYAIERYQTEARLCDKAKEYMHRELFGAQVASGCAELMTNQSSNPYWNGE